MQVSCQQCRMWYQDCARHTCPAFQKCLGQQTTVVPHAVAAVFGFPHGGEGGETEVHARMARPALRSPQERPWLHPSAPDAPATSCGFRQRAPRLPLTLDVFLLQLFFGLLGSTEVTVSNEAEIHEVCDEEGRKDHRMILDALATGVGVSLAGMRTPVGRRKRPKKKGRLGSKQAEPQSLRSTP